MNDLYVAAVQPGVPQQRDPNALVVPELRAPILPESDELFRSIYTRAAIGITPEMIGICSAIAGEGKTTVGMGMAVTLAQDFPERRILLVEADLQHPILAQDFEVEPSPGLTECLLNVNTLADAARPTYLDNFDLLPAGGPVESTGRLLRSSRMASATDAMRQIYDIVIVDLPAILVNSDSIILSDLLDTLVLVVRAGVTPAPVVSRAIEQLDASKLRGVVLNDSRSSTPGWLRQLCGL